MLKITEFNSLDRFEIGDCISETKKSGYYFKGLGTSDAIDYVYSKNMI
jgi:hypothetical protein